MASQKQLESEPRTPLGADRKLWDAGKRSGPRVSVIILSFNEERNLPGCLQSLDGLKCYVFVVDSYSTDQTPKIAKAFGATFTQHAFDNYAAQRNWSLDNLPIQTGWVLHLDADERLTPELVSEIDALLENPPADTAGFLLRKRTIFMGRWIRHGGHYPSYHLRLFRTGSGRCEDRLYDQHFLVNGRTQELSCDYLDMVTSDLSAWSLRHVRWAGMEAREMLSSNKGQQIAPDFLGNPIQRRRWWRHSYSQGPLFLRAFLYWCYRYFFRFGFLDGKEGLIFHFLQGFWFRFLVDALIWEQKRT